MLRPCTPGRPRRSDATFLPPRDVSTCGVERPGTTRTGRDGTGEWRRPGSQRYAVSSSSRCTTVLRVRAHVTLELVLLVEGLAASVDLAVMGLVAFVPGDVALQHPTGRVGLIAVGHGADVVALLLLLRQHLAGH